MGGAGWVGGQSIWTALVSTIGGRAWKMIEDQEGGGL